DQRVRHQYRGVPAGAVWFCHDRPEDRGTAWFGALSTLDNHHAFALALAPGRLVDRAAVPSPDGGRGDDVDAERVDASGVPDAREGDVRGGAGFGSAR